jgi:DNA polymerase III subunit gamma/tau
MTLLRLLAFAPREAAPPPAVALPAARPPREAGRSAAGAAPSPATGRSAAASAPAVVAATAVPVLAAASPLPQGQEWPRVVDALRVSGLARELAAHSELLSTEGDHFRLRVPIKSYAETANVERLRAALSEHFGRPLRVSVVVGNTGGAPTAATVAEQARAERLKNAEQAIYADPFVQELIENFGAQVEPQSIRPRES